MNLVWHQLRKDLRQHWVLIALWWLLVAWLGFFFSVHYHVVGVNGGLKWLSVIEVEWCIWLWPLTLCLLIQRLMQAETVVGTTEFWLTRPISRMQVLAAKLSFVLLVVVLPFLISEIYACQSYHISLRNTALIVLGILILILGPVLAVTFLAAMTPSFWKFCFYGVIGFIGGQITSGVANYLQNRNLTPEEIRRNSEVLAQYSLSRVATAGCLLTVGVILILLYLYRTRRRLFPLFQSIALYLVLVVVVLYSRWDVLNILEQTEAYKKEYYKPLDLADKVRFSVASSPSKVVPDSYYKNNEKILTRDLRIPLEVSSNDLRYVFLPEKVSVRLVYPNGKELKTDIGVSGGLWSNSDYAQLLSRTTGVEMEHLFNLPVPKEKGFTLHRLRIQLADFESFKKNGIAFQGEVRFGVYQCREIYELPLARGAYWGNGTEYARVGKVMAEKEGVGVNMIFGDVNLLLDPYLRLGDLSLQSLFFLRHRELKELYLVDRPGSQSMCSHELSDPVSFVSGEAEEISFNGPKNDSNKIAPPIKKQWLEGAKLVRYDVVRLGCVTRSFAMKDFKMDGPLKARYDD